jgi:hypothetical protein
MEFTLYEGLAQVHGLTSYLDGFHSPEELKEIGETLLIIADKAKVGIENIQNDMASGSTIRERSEKA